MIFGGFSVPDRLSGWQDLFGVSIWRGNLLVN